MEVAMIDLKFLRENPELVKENIRKKFQDNKVALVDEVIALDEKRRATQQEADQLRGDRKNLSKEIGNLMASKKKAVNKEEEEKILATVEAKKQEVAKGAELLARLEAQEPELEKKVMDIMMVIPNIIDPSVPIGKDDTENVEVTKYGEPVVPDFEIPYHTQIMERFCGIDLESAGKVAGNGFYYLMGDIARLHSAVLSYARDFMIGRGFVYCIPPYMIRSNVVTGVMSFAEMDAMMYKIEGEDLYLIGTSEHSMIGRFMDTILQEDKLPYALTSYSPCFRKEKGAHGIEERGVYRIHQFEKQEMIVVCKPEDSAAWFEKLWQNTVDFFRTLDIPVRTLECCSGDLADLKVKSFDVEAWSPRQKKYFEVGSCSNLGDAQARRLKIRINGENGKYFAHTLNNTVVAPPRMLIAFLENNLNRDFNLRIPQALRPYMGGQDILLHV
jgi:seryl-tRNA synthetase